VKRYYFKYVVISVTERPYCGSLTESPSSLHQNTVQGNTVIFFSKLAEHQGLSLNLARFYREYAHCSKYRRQRMTCARGAARKRLRALRMTPERVMSLARHLRQFAQPYPASYVGIQSTCPPWLIVLSPWYSSAHSFRKSIIGTCFRKPFVIYS